MQNIHKNSILAVAVLGLLAASAWWFTQNSFTNPLPIAEGDTIVWDLQGSYKDGGELEKRAEDTLARLRGLLGGDQSGINDDPTDYELYVGIANQYQLLGDGKKAYEYLGRAVAIDPNKTGLAWRSLGSLLERLGALQTARIAYSRAVEAQPRIEEYHIARLEFLISHFIEDIAAIESAIREAKAELGEAPSILQLEAEWHTKTGRTSDAIDALQEMQKQVGGDSNREVDREIARLRTL